MRKIVQDKKLFKYGINKFYMIEESEIAGLFQELKKNIDKDKEYLKRARPEVKAFWEGLVEGRELTVFEIYKYFEDIERTEISKLCKEIFGFK